MRPWVASYSLRGAAASWKAWWPGGAGPPLEWGPRRKAMGRAPAPGNPMNDRNLVRGLVLAAIALGFGLGALRYPIGNLAHAGAGLFPLLVSGLLLVVALITIARSRFVPTVPLGFNLKNIGLLLLALCSFALVTRLLHTMIAGIVVMVFIAGFAASGWSWQRNLKIILGLVAIAIAFQKLLGLSLPLWTS